MNNFPSVAQLINGKFWFHLLIFNLGQEKISGKIVMCCAKKKKR